MKTIFTTPTPDLSKSITFYKSLGFEVISANDQTYAVSSQLIMEINTVRTARAGIKIFGADLDQIQKSLGEHTKVVTTDTGILVSDPSNVWMYFEKGDFPEIDHARSNVELAGTYAGMSLETTDIEKSIKIWSCLSISKTMGDASKGWVAYTSKDGLSISFMAPNACPHLFFNPSLTYFNSGKNLEVVQKLRNANVPILEEITAFNPEGKVDNVILRDPGGFGFFVFND